MSESLETSLSENQAHFKHKQNKMDAFDCTQTVTLWSCRSNIGFEEHVYLVVLSYLQDKASRIERIVGEHQLFSQGLKELQDWVCEAQRVICTCTSTTTDKSVLEDRMLQLEVRWDRMDTFLPVLLLKLCGNRNYLSVDCYLGLDISCYV